MSDTNSKRPVSIVHPAKKSDKEHYAEIDFLCEDSAADLSNAKKAGNWFHYHRLSLILLALLISFAGYMICYYSKKETPADYHIAVISTIAIPEDTAAALERELRPFCTDQNADGKVVLALNRYVVDLSGDEDADLASAATGKIQLASDLQSDDCSYIFFTVDPQSLAESTGLLLSLDGTLFAENSGKTYENIDNFCYAWNDCPVLSGLELGEYKGYTVLDLETGSNQDVMSSFYICRRKLETEAQIENNKGCEELWNSLTAH